MDEKQTLRNYLERVHTNVLWKMDGLSERDLRWPWTPSGSNILGLVKHMASVELGYLGDVMGRPSCIPLPWLDDDADDNADMWATAEESVADITGLFAAARDHALATLDALPLDAPGSVPWWPPERRDVTLHQVCVHVLEELAQHLGHIDILRELADGRIGLGQTNPNLPDRDAAWWATYVDTLKRVAEGETS